MVEIEKTAPIPAAVTQQQISDLVDLFYTRVRSDSLLGPIFDRAIGNEWQTHLHKMKAFWATVLLAQRSYKGNPMITHLQLPRLDIEHFNRWLEMWSQAADEVCGGPAASIFVDRAEMIAGRLLNAIDLYHGAQPFPGNGPEAA